MLQRLGDTEDTDGDFALELSSTGSSMIIKSGRARLYINESDHQFGVEAPLDEDAAL